MHDAILDAAVTLLREGGLDRWTIDTVARAAGCAKGLINYHFGTKDTLLALVRERLEFERREIRLEVFAHATGTRALDRLWDALAEEVTTGAFGGWIDLVRHFGPSTRAGRQSDEERLAAAAARALGLAESEVVAQAPLLGPAMEGFQLRLLQGEPLANVREGFDRLWLVLLP